ncbi:MAG: thiamine pyrophosphate-dependent dehydrogenase E1 component subunit alpha, partial [Proteobacteria bacterium]|nr:thiamine pyrophosphate-dependent dehydrogenase E1 component subunit alpha [Pseudomonadota bacterium]
LAERYAEQEIRCPMHLSIGQEAAAVGVCAALEADDWVFSTHRSHAHYLARGGHPGRMLAELYGKAEGCVGGRGGSMHLIDRLAGFSGSTPIVGGSVPLALGAAFAFRTRDEPHVAVAFLGDGCFEEGIVHECLNAAALWSLPLVFVCENNLYSVYTRISERQPAREIWRVAKAHGWWACRSDGNDVRLVAELAREAVARARAGEGPQFLELDTYRWYEHCGPQIDDELGYRPVEEVQRYRDRCPVVHLRSWLEREQGLRRGDFEALETEAQARVEAAFGFARRAHAPAPETPGDGLYASA